MSLKDLPEVLTVEEAAEMLRIGRTAAYDLARQWRATGGQTGLPVVELGRDPPRAAERTGADVDGSAGWAAHAGSPSA